MFITYREKRQIMRCKSSFVSLLIKIGKLFKLTSSTTLILTEFIHRLYKCVVNIWNWWWIIKQLYFWDHRVRFHPHIEISRFKTHLHHFSLFIFFELFESVFLTSLLSALCGLAAILVLHQNSILLSLSNFNDTLILILIGLREMHPVVFGAGPLSGLSSLPSRLACFGRFDWWQAF